MTVQTQTEPEFKTYYNVLEAFERTVPFPTFAAYVGNTISIFNVFSIEPVGEYDDDEEEKIVGVEIEYCDVFGGSRKFFKRKIKFCDIVSIDSIRAKPSLESVVYLCEELKKPLQVRLNKFNEALVGAMEKLKKQS